MQAEINKVKGQSQSASILGKAHSLLEPIVTKVWETHFLYHAPIKSIAEISRSPSQIASSGNGIHFLSCLDRTAIFSQEMLNQDIPHRLTLTLIKRFLEPSKLGTSIELSIDGQKLCFLSATSGERVVASTPKIGSNGVNEIAYIEPWISPNLSFLDFFLSNPNAQPKFLIESERKFSSLLKKLQKRADSVAKFERAMKSRRLAHPQNDNQLCFQHNNRQFKLSEYKI